MGNVIQAGGGQAPARQAAIFAGNDIKEIFPIHPVFIRYSVF